MIVINNFAFNKDADKLNTLLYGASNGTSYPLLTDNNGKLVISSNSESKVIADNLPLTAFGDLSNTILTQVTGWTFNYALFNELVSFTSIGSGSNTIANSMISISTNITPNSIAKIQTTKALRYSPGFGALVRFVAIFSPGISNSSQIIGIGDSLDGFFFGYDGISFGISKRRAGVDSWIPKTTWNVDRLDGSGPTGMILDPSKGNVYQIQYQWLGFGLISFYIENSITGKFALIHQIKYANDNTVPSIYNPSLPIMAEVANGTNATNLTLSTSSAMGFIQGNGTNQVLTSRYTYYNTATNILSNVKTRLFTLRNRTTFNSKLNRIRISFNFISVSNDGNSSVNIFISFNPTLTGGTFTDINTSQSVVEYSTNGTLSGGRVILFFATAANNSLNIGSNDITLMLSPGDSIAVEAKSVQDASVSVSISWIELY